MRHRLCAVLAFAVLLSLAVTACSPRKAEAALDAVEDAVEQRLDMIEDVVEGKVRITPAPKTDKPKNKESAEYLSKEQVQTVALNHAGVTMADVTYVHAEFDMDDGVPEYNVEFSCGRREYEYEIHAVTGVIRSHDVDK